MKRVLLVILSIFITAAFLTGCINMASESYSAVGFVHGNTDTSAFMEFEKFKGNMYFTLKPKEGERIFYEASLEEGSLTVYEKTNAGKDKLFRVEAGEDMESSFDPKSENVTLIIETDGACKNGKVRFNVEEEL